MKKYKAVRCALAVLMTCLFCMTTSYADVGSDNAGMEKLVKQLEKQVASLQKEIQTLSAAKPAVPKDIEDDIKSLQRDFSSMKADQAKATKMPSVPAAAGAVPSWLEGTNFGGDIRVRFQSNQRSNDAAADQNYGRMRLRYGISKQVNDELYAKFRLASGGAGWRAYYHSMGSTTSGFNKMAINVDQAYLKYTPNWLENTAIYAGKFPINWKDKGILIHSEGCGVEGLGESFTYQVTDGIKGDLNLAQLVMTEGTVGGDDSQMFVFDSGISGSYEAVTWGLRGTAYIFNGLNSQLGSTNALANTNATTGNPRTIVATGDVGFDVCDIPVATFVQGGLNVNARDENALAEDQNRYYALGVGINKLKKPGDVSFNYKFMYLQGNVMPGFLPDADLVARNAAGGNQMHQFELSYRLFDSTDLNLSVLAPRTLDAADNDTEEMRFKLQATTSF
ncbi:MAG: putative porin [Candidatus Omnitrophota bacterium]